MLIQLLLLLLITSYCLYVRKTFQVSLTIIASSLLLLTFVDGFSFVPWLIVLLTSISFFMPDLRRQYVSTPVYNIFKYIKGDAFDL